MRVIKFQQKLSHQSVRPPEPPSSPDKNNPPVTGDAASTHTRVKRGRRERGSRERERERKRERGRDTE